MTNLRILQLAWKAAKEEWETAVAMEKMYPDSEHAHRMTEKAWNEAVEIGERMYQEKRLEDRL